MLLLVLCHALNGETFGQSTVVPLSTFGSGYGHVSGEVDVRGIVGQLAPGRASGSGNVVSSGLMPATLVSLNTLDVPLPPGELPKVFSLAQNFPNPFNPSTRIRYQLPAASKVTLIVYDLLGREVAVLADEKKEPGNFEVEFNASGLASGVYIYRLTAGSYVSTRKMITLK
jgi:hypothetical protein